MTSIRLYHEGVLDGKTDLKIAMETGAVVGPLFAALGVNKPRAIGPADLVGGF